MFGVPKSDDSELVPLHKRYVVSKPLETYHFNQVFMIAHKNWVRNWNIRKALLEYLSNCIDQSRTVGNRFNLTGHLEYKEMPEEIILHVGQIVLGRIKWGFRKVKYTESYESTGSTKERMKPCNTSTAETQFIEFTNYSSYLPVDAFGIGRSTKASDDTVIGRHGEGLPGACVALCREGCQVTALCPPMPTKRQLSRKWTAMCATS